MASYHSGAVERRGDVIDAETAVVVHGDADDVEPEVRLVEAHPLEVVLGEHTDEILAELGYRADEIVALRAKAVI